VGNTTQTITGPEELGQASNEQITFIGNKKYAKSWESSKACAAIINNDIVLEPGDNRAFIKVKNADIAMAEVLELFVEAGPVFETDIHPTAVIHATAKFRAAMLVQAAILVQALALATAA
jgi:UDP-3-O-[3-hydroxymyristoyl] glucosamine N-acyltransferase